MWLYFDSQGLSVAKNTFSLCTYLLILPLGISSQQCSHVSLLSQVFTAGFPSNLPIHRNKNVMPTRCCCCASRPEWATCFLPSAHRGLRLCAHVTNEGSCHQMAKLLHDFQCRQLQPLEYHFISSGSDFILTVF